MDVDQIIQAITSWAAEQPSVQGVALVGSYARGMARTDSDQDIVVLTRAPQMFRDETAWCGKAVGAQVRTWQDEDYGQLWSRRLWLEYDGSEIEIGFASPSWADVTKVRHLQIAQKNPTVGVWVGAHPTGAFRCELGELGFQRSVRIEEFFRPVALHPAF
jgi:uncharacterized protein